MKELEVSESAPKFVKGLEDMTVKEEQTVNFAVKFSGKPKPTVKWTKDGEEFEIDSLRMKSVAEAENSVTITIYKASKEDMGTYTCTISNSKGSESTSSKLTVTEASSSPEFTQKLKDKEIKEGEDAVFTVKFKGNPQPTGKWTFDGQKFPIDGQRIEQKYEDDYSKLTLIIHACTSEDAGQYACTITSSMGSETCSAKLLVAVPPVFTKYLKDIEAEEGAPLTLDVKFEGQPDPTVTWKKDGNLLEIDGKKIKLTMEKSDSVSLLIEKVKPEDAGKYSCELVNSQGSTFTSNKVTVSGRPIIKKGLIDRHAFDADTNIEFMVEATGTPAPEIKWLFKDQEVKDGENFALSQTIPKGENKGIYKLIIKKFSAETTGELKFVASNAAGKAETQGVLYLLKKPVFLKGLTDLVINEEDPLKLEVTVSGIPVPEVKWYYGPRLQEIRPHIGRLIKVKGNKHTLIIEETAVEDSGTYVCKATNRVGEASQQITVSVKCK